MLKSTFKISKMDCPSEENLIRMKLSENNEVVKLVFNVPDRELIVHHTGSEKLILELLETLSLGTTLIESTLSTDVIESDDQQQSRLLWHVLIINFTFFILEVVFGIIAKSMGLIADSLDMLADSFVYGLSLVAVGGSIIKKKNIAKIAGYFQITLAIIGFTEVIRRFIGSEGNPHFQTMIFVSIFALVANGLCLYLLQKSKDKDQAHMKASMIFTSNDIVINLGVITAGILVKWLDSNKPDLIVGSIVFALVIQGALRILKLGK